MKSRKSAAASDNLESLSSSALVDAKISTNAARSSRLVTSNFRPSENLLSFIVENPDETAAAEVEACSDIAKFCERMVNRERRKTGKEKGTGRKSVTTSPGPRRLFVWCKEDLLALPDWLSNSDLARGTLTSQTAGRSRHRSLFRDRLTKRSVASRLI